jgi:hypothetical protein
MLNCRRLGAAAVLALAPGDVSDDGLCPLGYSERFVFRRSLRGSRSLQTDSARTFVESASGVRRTGTWAQGGGEFAAATSWRPRVGEKISRDRECDAFFV